jgi:hypothetical protein
MKSAFVLALSALALAGCQQGAGGGSFTSNVVTTPTKAQKLNFASSLHPDCTAYGPIEMRVLTQPTNGSVRVSQTQDYPRYLSGNQRYHCNAKRVPGVLVLYTPRSGFIGQDTVVTETFYPTGTSRRNTFNITVR